MRNTHWHSVGEFLATKGISTMKHLFRALALVAMHTAVAAPVLGAVDDETATALLKRIEAQDARIAELEKEKQAPATVLPVAPAPAAVAKVETKGGLKVQSADGKNSFSFGGRIHADAAQYSDDRDASGDSVFGNGTAFRRVRFDAKGTFLQDWGYRVQYDFVDSGAAGLKDAFITFERYEPWNLQFGQFFQPFGLERQTSSNYITFLERALPTNALTPDRHIGLQVASGGALGDGKLGDPVPFWTAKAGIFGMRAQDDNASTGGADESRDLTGRVTVAPIYDGNRLLQAGFSYRHHEPKDTGTFTRFRERPEAAVSQVRLVDTGDLSGGIGLVNDFQQIGADLAAIWGPFAAQGEWMKTNVDRGQGLAGPETDPEFSGAYAQVSWIITGESRGFKPSDAAHDKLKPGRPFGDGGWGAWEVGVRYSTLDLTDAGVIGGEEDNLTVGLNWYPNENLRFMANFVKVLELDRPGNDLDRVEPEIFQLRAQVTW